MSAFNFLERKRIRFHLMGVEEELRNKDVGSLRPGLREERLRNLGFLKDYRKMGKFPVNTRYPGEVLPHIKDEKGTLCAMAYVIEKSGHGHLVENLAENNNLIRLEDVSGGPVTEWLSTSGLTREESAKIQPGYYGHTPDTPVFWFLPWGFFWISFTLALISLEYVNYRLVKHFKIKKPKIKYLTHAYLAAGALAISVVLAFVVLFLFLLFGAGPFF